MLRSLDEAEMPLRQRERRLARQRSEHRDIERCDRVGNQRPMALARDPIEDDAGNAHGRIVRGKAAHYRGCRLRLPRHVEHQHDRQSEMGGEIGGGAAPVFAASGRAVEQAHDAFDHHDVGAVGGVRGERVEQSS